MNFQRETALSHILERVEKIPPVPAIVRKVIDIVQKPEVAIQEIVKVVMLDESLTFRVLRAANSAYYRRGGPESKTVQEALIRLGNNALVNLVIAESCSPLFKNAGEGYELKRGELWRHSMGCALLSQQIAAFTGFQKAENLFTAAIVHDLGKTLLDNFVHARRAALHERMTQFKMTYTEAEFEVLGMHHGEIGARLLEKWSFAPDITEAVRFHHDPLHAPSAVQDLVFHVYLSDMVCMMLGVGLGLDGLAYPANREIWDYFKMSESDFQRFSLMLLEELAKAEEWLRT